MPLNDTQRTALAAELTNDPLTRGYSGMSDEQALSSLTAQDRDLQLSSITGDQAFSVTDSGQWNALTDAQKSQWLAFCGRQSIDPFGAANVALVIALFGAGTATVTALAALRTVSNGQSRAQELGFGGVVMDDIIRARA